MSRATTHYENLRPFPPDPLSLHESTYPDMKARGGPAGGFRGLGCDRMAAILQG